MELWEIDHRASISLSWTKVDYGGVHAKIRVQDGDFTGSNKLVYFLDDAFRAFIAALDHFTQHHEGEARLESANPGEFLLSIRTLDTARHVLLEAQVAHDHFLRDHLHWDRVWVTFELAPSVLPEIVQSLTALMAGIKPHNPHPSQN